MGKIIVSNFLSIDGLFSDANGSTTWVVDHPHPIETYLKQQLTEVDAIIFGANTYRMMAEYWPTSRSEHEDEVVTIRAVRYKPPHKTTEEIL